MQKGMGKTKRRQTWLVLMPIDKVTVFFPATYIALEDQVLILFIRSPALVTLVECPGKFPPLLRELDQSVG